MGQVEGSADCFAVDFVILTVTRKRILHIHRPQNALALNLEVTIIEFFKMKSIKSFLEQVKESI